MNEMRVLIVDDDYNMADSLHDILEIEGYESKVVYNGNDAIELAKKEEFDCFLIDIRMPDINGVDVYQALKKIQLAPHVIFMTGYSVPVLVKNAIEEGAIEVLSKPLDIPRLLDLIKEAQSEKYDKNEKTLVLIVEDDQLLCESLKDILTQDSYLVETTDSPSTAVSLVERGEVDIVLLDMRLDKGSGSKTFYMIRKLNPTIIVILMTGYREEMKDEVEKILGECAYTCLYKPFEPERLLKILRNARKHGKKQG